MPQREVIPVAWLYREVACDEAERIFADDRGVAFGSANAAWLELLRGLSEADKLYIYNSKGHIAPDACANMGVCVVRHGRVTRHLLVRIG